MQKSSKKKQHSEQHEEGEGWLISYADLMTVLCCFFILIVSMANFDPVVVNKKGSEVAEHFSKEDAKGSSSAKGNGGADGSAKAQEVKAKIEAMYKEISAAVSNNGLARVAIKDGVEIVFTGITMFEGGESKPSALVDSTLDIMVEIIKSKGVDFPIIIEGHTDDRPINSPHYPSNWELSAARASYVLRKFEKVGFHSENLVAVGYAHTRPAYPPTNALGRAIAENQKMNRRVVIKVLPPKTDYTKERLGLGTYFKSIE